MSVPLTTGKTVAAFAWLATMQSAIERRVDREGVAPPPRDPRHGGVEAAGVVVPDRDARAHGEARGVLDRDLLLAEVAVEGQRRDGPVGLAEDRLALPAADRDVRAEVERVAHQVLALADLDDPAAQARDIIDGRLEGPVVGPDDVRPRPAHRDRGPLAHLRVHRARKLPLVRLRGEVVGGSGSCDESDGQGNAAEATEERD